MDDTVRNELTVRPVSSREVIEADFQIIVRTVFEGQDGSRYVGYVYWRASDHLGDLQPVVFVGAAGCVTFWSGMLEPAWSAYPLEMQALRLVLPVSFTSEVLFEMASISGVLEGLYYFKNIEDGSVGVVA
ncbi:hypothetical protein KJF94_04205 [Pseudomonas hormoni]|uniref:Uncharacterized protein n=1 Tax=Pseudomonas hormoni TaxID=3093767 RepID=A0ABX8EYH6_9PSED|nr:hypothetical protein [Pseudomonas hormoni]QVW24794.1 hypothetical protein KJF94_04205 [Pseudomonas hormoni]